MKWTSILNFCILTILSCSHADKGKEPNKSDASKIIITKAFSAKRHFDNWIEDKPAYNMGYDETITMDFSWNKRHYDKFDNVIYEERFSLNKDSSENIYRKTTFDYYDAKTGKLKQIQEEGQFPGTIKKDFIRRSDGLLTEIKATNSDKLFEKTIFTYNEYGQRIKREVYKEDGLYEYNSYKYDNTSNDGKLISERHEVFGDYNYREDFTYERNDANLILKMNRKYFEKNILKSELTTTYFDYKNEFATKIVEEGYYSPTTWTDGTVVESTPHKKVITFQLNSNNDILSYTLQMIEANSNPDEFSNKIKLQPLRVVYECDYKYNSNGDWTQLIFKVSKNDIYIINREIQYLK